MSFVFSMNLTETEMKITKFYEKLMKIILQELRGLQIWRYEMMN